MPCPRFCCRCNARPALPGRCQCERCVPLHRASVEARRARLKAAGLCRDCGKRPIVEGNKNHCTVCREKSRIAGRKWKDRMRARGLF